MNKIFFCLVLVFSAFFQTSQLLAETLDAESFYNIEAELASGEKVRFLDYKNKVVLVANIATKCGTTPQLSDLQKLHAAYSKRGLVILGFPSNDFSPEPKGDMEIKNFCTLKYGVTFPIFSQISVKGDKIHNLFSYLTTEIDSSMQGPVSFNFEKFIVDKNGVVRKRYGPFTGATSEVVTAQVEELLGE